MTQGYKYKAFGLTIDSDLPFDELEGSEVLHTDVCIREVEHIAYKKKQDDCWFEVSNNHLFFEIEAVGQFEVKDGRELNYVVFEGAELDCIRLFILGSGFAGIFHQRQLVPLHAGAYDVKGNAVLIAGDSGAGKSTTGFGLHQKGYPLIADDVCVLHPKDDHVNVCSGYPQMKLWQSSLDLFDIPSANLKRVVSKETKYRLLPNKFQSGEERLARLFFLKKSEAKRERVEQVSGMVLLELLHQNVFRSFFMVDNELSRAVCFEVFSMLMQTTKCYLIERNPEHFGVDQLVPLIEELSF